jgi:hypothetical protein
VSLTIGKGLIPEFLRGTARRLVPALVDAVLRVTEILMRGPGVVTPLAVGLITEGLYRATQARRRGTIKIH